MIVAPQNLTEYYIIHYRKEITNVEYRGDIYLKHCCCSHSVLRIYGFDTSILVYVSSLACRNDKW